MTLNFGRRLAIISCSLAWLAVCHAVESSHNDEMRAAREQAKPWLMRDATIFGTKLPISPATIISIVLFFLNLWRGLSSMKRWAEASHILIKDNSSANKKMMTEMRKDIGSDLKRFGDFAQKYSQCPTKAQKGDLGRFKPGDMAPPFEKVVFDPSSAMEMCLGPIQTQFGYHLIFIRQRKI